MARKIIVVTAAYGNDHVKALGGQSAVLPFIAGSGADGVEIRRELFSAAELKQLPTLAADIEKQGLLACYSAPQALFIDNGELNPHLPSLLEEAQTLNALWLKLSLGHFIHNQQLETLRDILSASGMALVDTLDNVLMVGAYGWAFSKPQRKLYYNMIITATSVVVALFIGGLEALGLLMDKFALSGGVWRWVGALNDNLGDAGFVVVGLFVVCWALSVLNYRWRGYDNLAR